jgi:hypothetical protein
MRKLLLSGAAFGVLGMPAMAADVAPAYKIPVPVPAFSWSGCYVGGDVGGAWGSQGVLDTSPVAFAPPPLRASTRPGGPDQLLVDRRLFLRLSELRDHLFQQHEFGLCSRRWPGMGAVEQQLDRQGRIPLLQPQRCGRRRVPPGAGFVAANPAWSNMAVSSGRLGLSYKF